MRCTRFTPLAFLAVTAAVGLLTAAPEMRAQTSQQTTATPSPDVAKLGPQVGDKVPDFSLRDQHGQTRTLASLMGAKGLVLVFNRSADW